MSYNKPRNNIKDLPPQFYGAEHWPVSQSPSQVSTARTVVCDPFKQIRNSVCGCDRPKKI